MSRIITVIMVLAISFVVAFTFACVAMEEATPGPTPTPTISPSGIAASRIATLMAATRDATISRHLRTVALTAESEAIAAEAILKNAPEDEKAKWEATATATRLIADAARATAVAASEPPEFLATETAEWANKNATQEVEDAWAALRGRRAKNCRQASEIRDEVAAADRWYASRDVSIGELSVFHPAEATARAEALQRATKLCP